MSAPVAEKCRCHFPPWCDGSGQLICSGCGGPVCACAPCLAGPRGHGVQPCPGCVYCKPKENKPCP